MRALAALFALLAVPPAPPATAEPYLAVKQGFKCMVCHVNPTGGGMRNAYGNTYARTLLAAQQIETASPDVWSEYNLLAIGGDLRTAAVHTSVPGRDDFTAFETQELRVYIAANVIPERLVVYLDQAMSPGSINQEAYARLRFEDGRYYVKAGRMYLPYGLRLEDDSAFIREVPGINMTTPDNGVEAGFEGSAWSVQFAASNGGGAESDQGKQGSVRAEFVQPSWRLGGSASFNHREVGDRQAQNVFAGLRTGAFGWLAEVDYVTDDGFATGKRGLWASLIETNWAFAAGRNLKLTYEFSDPDDDVAEDERERYSAVWEHTPIQFLQLRGGLRVYEGIPQNPLDNRRHFFLELHGFF